MIITVQIRLSGQEVRPSSLFMVRGDETFDIIIKKIASGTTLFLFN